jgi:hypothetical protein
MSWLRGLTSLGRRGSFGSPGIGPPSGAQGLHGRDYSRLFQAQEAGFSIKKGSVHLPGSHIGHAIRLTRQRANLQSP